MKTLLPADHIRKTPGKNRDYYLVVLDERGAIRFANSHLVTNFELTPEKITGSSFFNMLESSHVQVFKEALQYAAHEEKPAIIEISARNGSLHWIKWEIRKFKSTHPGNKFFCIGYDMVEKNKVRKFKNIAESNYKAIVEGLDAGIVMLDMSGEVLAANQKTSSVLEIDLEEIYSEGTFKNLWSNMELHDEVPLTFAASPCAMALATGITQSQIHVVYKTPAGGKKNLVLTVQPLFENDNPKPVSAVASFIDITREKQLETELRKQDILFRTFMNHSPSLAWMVEEDATLVFANRTFYKYLGLDESSLNKNLLEMVPAVFAEALHQKHLNVIETGKPQRTREIMFLADGKEIAFLINLFPVPATGEKKLIGGEAIDITDQLKTQQQLKMINEKLSHLSHISTEAVWEWDLHTGHISRNEMLQELIGFKNDAMKNFGWWLRRIHPDDRAAVSGTVRYVMDAKKQNWECEYRFRKASGDYIYIMDRGYVIYENDLPVKMIGSIQDRTKIKELEEKLVQEKVQWQKEITETIFTVQEKERTRMGHELHDNVNQLLATGKLFLDLVKTGSDQDQELKEKASHYIVSAVEEIRKLSKEMVTPQLKERGLIASINTLVADLKTAHVFNVLFYHQDEIESLSAAKKVTLFRIVQEQIKNTLKYSKAKNLTITLQRAGIDVQLMIEDDGVGFDPAQTRRGIGLSNIYERTKFYNGKVQISTAPGKGCRITVNIPLHS